MVTRREQFLTLFNTALRGLLTQDREVIGGEWPESVYSMPTQSEEEPTNKGLMDLVADANELATEGMKAVDAWVQADMAGPDDPS